MTQLSLLDAISERDRILTHFAENKKAYLAGCRAFGRAHAHEHGEVCVDDVRDAMASAGYPMPSDIGIDERCFGALFRCAEFEPIRQQPTSRVAWAARVGRARSSVTVYRLRNVTSGAKR